MRKRPSSPTFSHFIIEFWEGWNYSSRYRFLLCIHRVAFSPHFGFVTVLVLFPKVCVIDTYPYVDGLRYQKYIWYIAQKRALFVRRWYLSCYDGICWFHTSIYQSANKSFHFLCTSFVCMFLLTHFLFFFWGGAFYVFCYRLLKLVLFYNSNVKLSLWNMF